MNVARQWISPLLGGGAVAIACTGCGGRSGLVAPDPAEPAFVVPAGDVACEHLATDERWLIVRTLLADDRRGLEGVLVGPDRSERADPIVEARPLWEGDVAWSSDGRFLAYVADSEDSGRLSVLRMDCKVPVTVLQTPARRVAWARDAMLVFATQAPGELFAIDLDIDGTPRRLAALDELEGFLPAPVGNLVLFGGADESMLVVDAASESPEPRLATQRGGHTKWSPDGTRFGFNTMDSIALVTVPLDGAPEQTELAAISTKSGAWPFEWSADGRWFAFESPIAPKGNDLAVYDVTSGETLHPAPHPGVRVRDWSLSPDGRGVVLLQGDSPSADGDLHWVELPAGTSHRLHPPRLDHERVWFQGWLSPRNEVLYTSDRDAKKQFALYRVAVEKGAIAERLTPPLTEGRTVDSHSVQVADGRALYATMGPVSDGSPFELVYFDGRSDPAEVFVIAAPALSSYPMPALDPRGDAVALKDQADRPVVHRLGSEGISPPEIVTAGEPTFSSWTLWQPRRAP